jgi:RNA-dependent RNA polymerase
MALIDVDNIRGWMGDLFSIRNVAKCAARMGQSFSSSTETMHVYGHEIGIVPDIQVRNGERTYNFSDGIRKLSLPLAKHVALKCGCEKNSKRISSAFQIRYGGYKGVVAVDPTSSDKLSLRDLNYPDKTGT